MLGKITRFAKNRGGVAAIEFALIAPLMVAFYMVTVEFQDYFTVDRKLTALTSAVGDVISQDDVVTDQEISDIFKAVSSMMSPYDSSALKIRVSQVDVDNKGKVKVAWGEGKNIAGRAEGSSFTLPAKLVIKNTSYVVSESQFSYKSVVGYIIPNGVTLDRIFYIQPRYTNSIKRL